MFGVHLGMWGGGFFTIRMLNFGIAEKENQFEIALPPSVQRLYYCKVSVISPELENKVFLFLNTDFYQSNTILAQDSDRFLQHV